VFRLGTGTKLRNARRAVKKKSACVSKESEEKMWESGKLLGQGGKEGKEDFPCFLVSKYFAPRDGRTT
jgi:hypothetical protein